MLFALVALAASTATVDPSSNPLDDAKDGRLQCYQPDEQRRICRSIASYVQTRDNTYANKATVLLSNDGPVTLETTTTVTIKLGAVCGFIRAEDINAGKLRIAARVLSDTEAAPLLVKVAQSMSGLIGREICTSYIKTGDVITAKATINGVYQPDADQQVKWIKPSDRYSVEP